MKTFSKIRRLLKENLLIILAADIVLLIATTAFVLSFDKPGPVKGLKVDGSTYSTVSLSWDKAKNATGYRIYRAGNKGDYTYAGSSAENSFTDKKVRTGTDYRYLVVARNGLRTSDKKMCDGAEAMPSLDTPEIKVDTSKGNMELNITRVDGATAYYILRDGKVIGKTSENVYVDADAENDSNHEYEAMAIRYRVDPVFSNKSNKVDGELHAIPEFTITADESDLIIDWDSSEYYDNYKLYNGKTLLTETNEPGYIISDYSMDQTYDIKLIGYSEDGKNKSPMTSRRVRVFEEPMDNEGARKAACDWGVAIANDNSFTYGTGSTAHRCGCYFCGTNSSKKGSGYEKTYCCNPFVHACYAHGAGDPQMLRDCQDGDSVGMNSSDYTGYGNWTNIGLPPMSSLEPGDVMVSEGHVMLYIGDGQIVHAASEGWDASSIRVDNASSFYGGFTRFVVRYEGTGSGTMYKVRDVDENGKKIDNTGTEKKDEHKSKVDVKAKEDNEDSEKDA